MSSPGSVSGGRGRPLTAIVDIVSIVSIVLFLTGSFLVLLGRSLAAAGFLLPTHAAGATDTLAAPLFCWVLRCNSVGPWTR